MPCLALSVFRMYRPCSLSNLHRIHPFSMACPCNIVPTRQTECTPQHRNANDNHPNLLENRPWASSRPPSPDEQESNEGCCFCRRILCTPCTTNSQPHRNTFPLNVWQHGITAYQFLFTWYQAIPREQKTKRHLQFLNDLYIHKTSRFRDARYIYLLDYKIIKLVFTS